MIFRHDASIYVPLDSSNNRVPHAKIVRCIQCITNLGLPHLFRPSPPKCDGLVMEAADEIWQI